ncbi:MAG: alpha/beta fold hydrolase [Polyangiales bacterium]
MNLRLRGWRRRHVTTSVGRVHMLEARGRGHLPPTVLLHGLSAAGSHYGPLLERLRRRTSRVIAPDLPAHGFSDTPGEVHLDALYDGMRQALDRVLDGPAVLVGNSLGGAVALRYALDRPGRVRGLALLSPGGAPMTHPELSALKDLFRVDTHADALQFVDRVMVRPGAMRGLYAMGIRWGFGRGAVRDLVDALSVEHALSPEQVRALRVPVRVLWGAEERVLPASGRRFFEDHLPAHGRVEVHPGLGHCPHLDDCDRVAGMITGWCHEFAQVPPA